MNRYRTKKTFWVAAFIAGMLMLSVTASEAAIAPGIPGCDNGDTTAHPSTADGPAGGFWGVMKEQSDSYRVRDQALLSEKMKKTSTALGLTCFDKAMALTSRLGEIFSDDFTVNPGVMNNSIFGNGQSLFQDMGISDKLGTSLSAIINGGNGSADGDGGILAEFMGGGAAGGPTTNDNFSGSLSDTMGYTVASSLNDLFSSLSQAVNTITGLANGFLTSIQNAVGAVQGVINQITGALSDVGSYLNSNGANYVSSFMSNAFSFNWLTEIQNLFSTVMGYVDTYAGYVQTGLDYVNMAGNLVDQYGNTFSSYMTLATNYINQIQGASTSMANLSVSNLLTQLGVTPIHQNGVGCNGLHDIWNGVKQAGATWAMTAAGPVLQNGVQGIFGDGPLSTATLPFFTLDDMVTPGGITTAGTDLLGQITGGNVPTSNAALIQAAYENLQNSFFGPYIQGISAAGSRLPIWKQPQFIPSAGASVDEVICSMKNMAYPC